MKTSQSQALCDRHYAAFSNISVAVALPRKVTAVGFEPTPFRNGALSHRLRPLGQTVLVTWQPPRGFPATIVAGTAKAHCSFVQRAGHRRYARAPGPLDALCQYGPPESNAQLCLSQRRLPALKMRTPGVEPGSQAWEACMMPLHYVRS